MNSSRCQRTASWYPQSTKWVWLPTSQKSYRQEVMFELCFEAKRYKEKKKAFQAGGISSLCLYISSFGQVDSLLAPPEFLCSVVYSHSNMDMPFPSTYPCQALCSEIPIHGRPPCTLSSKRPVPKKPESPFPTPSQILSVKAFI